MSRRRRYVLSGVVAALAFVAAAVLRDVLATVFFAVTVAAVFAPVYRRLVGRGVPEWWASAVTSALAFLAAVAVFTPLVAVLYRRRDQLLDLFRSLPSAVEVEFLGYSRVIPAGEVRTVVASYLGEIAVDVAAATPVLAIKFALFGFVVFGFLLGSDRAYRAVVGTVPVEYRGVVEALHERARSTLFAIYVLQAATALGTFAVALVLFFALGYSGAVTLAVVAGVLQFLPIVGPSVLLGVLVAYELLAGEVAAAAIVGVAGAVFVGYLPDVVIRSRLARRSANMPSTLYFIGFTGGLLTVGPIGIIAGPLAVALLAEGVDLLSAETGGYRQSTLAEDGGTDADDGTGEADDGTGDGRSTGETTADPDGATAAESDRPDDTSDSSASVRESDAPGGGE